MKKVLWICNIMLPAIAKEVGFSYSNREGWLSGIFQRVAQEKKDMELAIAFPVSQEEMDRLPNGIEVKGMFCYPFVENLGTPEIYDEKLEGQLASIIKKVNPDILHIFGTEFPHALAAARVFKKPERTLIGIQGLCGEIAKVYMAGLPGEVQNQVTLRDFLRKDSLKQQQNKFVLRGRNEKEALELIGNITGRTTFDKEGTEKINPSANYFFMNETMRSDFYDGKWELSSCERRSLFLGQGDYPLKGMHFVLEAMAKLKIKFPDMKLYVAGNSVIEHATWKQKLKLPAYGKYLLSLIKKYELENMVIMTGKLSAAEMKERFLKSHIFLCPSVLENSPNTVGEAMLLGVPVVAAGTGGIPDMLTDGEEGLLFENQNAIDLSEKIELLFEQEKLAQRISEAARERAAVSHNGEQNYARLLEIYEAI